MQASPHVRCLLLKTWACEYTYSLEPHTYNLIPRASLSPRPKANPSTDRFQYRTRVILEAIYAPDEVWGQDYPRAQATSCTNAASMELKTNWELMYNFSYSFAI